MAAASDALRKKKKKSRLNNTEFAAPMGRTDIMKPVAVSGRHQTDETDA